MYVIAELHKKVNAGLVLMIYHKTEWDKVR